MGFATAGLILAAAPAHAICTGIGAAQTCTDGMNRTYTSDQETRRIIPLNKPLLAYKPAEPVKLPIDSGKDDSELRAADKSLNFVRMYPGFALNR